MTPIEIFEKLQFYFQFSFVQYAVIVGILISICSSLLGVTLVLKRYSYIGDGLSHVAFGAMAIAAVLNFSNNIAIILPITLFCAVLLLGSGKNSKVKGDAAIAMVSVGALAIGYLLMNLFGSSVNLAGDVCTTLFGSTSILTLTKTELKHCIILSVIIIAAFIFFYNKIFSMTFDEDFSRAIGIPIRAYNLIIAVIIAVIIVLAMKFVGSLLVSALIVFPSLAAMRLFKTFRSVTVASVCISLFCAVSGLFTSILAGTPVGCTIVVFDMIAFFLCFLGSGFRTHSKG